MDLQKDNQQKIETLKEEKEKLKATVDELKYSGTGNTHKRKMVDDSEENLSVATVKLERVKDKYEKSAKKLLGVKAGIRHLTEKVESIREEDDQHILITDDTVVEAFYQVESLLTRLLKEINRSKATSPTPSQKLAVAKNLTIMGISDREIMETRPYNQRVNLVAGNGNAFDAFVEMLIFEQSHLIDMGFLMSSKTKALVVVEFDRESIVRTIVLSFHIQVKCRGGFGRRLDHGLCICEISISPLQLEDNERR